MLSKHACDYLVPCLGQNDKNAQAKQKKKKMTDEEILSRLSKNMFSMTCESHLRKTFSVAFLL